MYRRLFFPAGKQFLKGADGIIRQSEFRRVASNSRPLEFDSSWFAHSDSYSMIRHGLRAEKGVWWGCAAAKTSSKLTISDLLGELTAHRERDAGPASRQSARRFLGINTRLRRILKDWPLPFDATYESRQQLRH